MVDLSFSLFSQSDPYSHRASYVALLQLINSQNNFYRPESIRYDSKTFTETILGPSRKETHRDHKCYIFFFLNGSLPSLRMHQRVVNSRDCVSKVSVIVSKSSSLVTFDV